MTKSNRDAETEFETLRALLIGRNWADDNGPMFTVASVDRETTSPGPPISATVSYVNHRVEPPTTCVTSFDYDLETYADGGPETTAELLLVDIEEEVLTRNTRAK